MSNSNGCLTKADLVEAIFESTSIDKAQAVQIVEDWFELVKVGLERDQKVKFSGFGVFEVKEKHARPGRNPQTGDRITLDSRKVVRFKPSQILRQYLNKSIEQPEPTPISE